MPTTLDVYETRRENLNRLLEHKGSKTQLALRLGATQAHITHLLKPPEAASARQIKEETARQIEQVMGLAPGELDRSPGMLRHLGAREAPALAYHPDARVVNVMAHQVLPDTSMDLLEQVVKAVLEEAERHSVRLAPEKAASMVRLVCEQGVKDGQLDRTFIASLLKLIK